MRGSFVDSIDFSRLLAEGDHTAWVAMLELFRPGLSSRVRYLLCRNGLTDNTSVDDVLQDTWLRSWSFRGSFHGSTRGELASWLLTIVHRVFVDHCRGAQREVCLSSFFGFAGDGETPSAQAISLEHESILHACLSELDPRQAQVLAMRHFEGLKFREIAEALGENPNTVAGWYRRGLEQLAARLKQVDPHSSDWFMPAT